MTMITVYKKKSILDTRLALLLGLVCNKGGDDNKVRKPTEQDLKELQELFDQIRKEQEEQDYDVNDYLDAIDEELKRLEKAKEKDNEEDKEKDKEKGGERGEEKTEDKEQDKNKEVKDGKDGEASEGTKEETKPVEEPVDPDAPPKFRNSRKGRREREKWLREQKRLIIIGELGITALVFILYWLFGGYLGGLCELLYDYYYF